MELLHEGRFSPVYISSSEDFISHYNLKVVQVLGSGMSGKVVLATTSATPAHSHAIKIMSLDSDVDEKRKYFYNEIKAMRKFNHQNLMKGICAYENPDRLFILMKYCSLGSIETHSKLFNFQMIELYLVQLASAVRHMHTNRYAHTDIKLANVLLVSKVQVCLADFGISFEMSRYVHEIPAKHVGGTDGYRPPEQVFGNGETLVNPMKMDMYSLGVVLSKLIQKQLFKQSKLAPGDPKKAIKVPEILQSCMTNLMNDNFRERFSSKELVEALIAGSRWGALADLLERKYNMELAPYTRDASRVLYF